MSSTYYINKILSRLNFRITLRESSKCVPVSLRSTGTTLSLVNNICHIIRGDQNTTPSSGFLKKLKTQFLHDGVGNVLTRVCHILEYSCTLYNFHRSRTKVNESTYRPQSFHCLLLVEV